MDFESLKKKEREGWMAMRFGCCASKDEVEDSREGLGPNGMLRFYLYSHLHVALSIVDIAVSYFVLVASFSFIFAFDLVFNTLCELDFVASALLNPVNVNYQRQHNPPLNNHPTRSLLYLTILMANNLQQGPRICRLYMTNHRLCRNLAPNPSTLVHPPASPSAVMSLNG
jgi:hypothetical protein